MLVLNRGVDESIAIGDSIVVTVLKIDGDQVKIGIQAPKEIRILRGEILEAVLDQIKIQQKMIQNPDDGSFSELRKILAEDAGEQPPAEEKTDRKEKK